MVDAVRSRAVTTSKETYNCGSHSGVLAEWLLRDDVTAYVDEDIRHAIIIAFLRLLESGRSETLTFPSSLTAKERAFVHMVAKLLGLRSQSFG
ncbi:hypothetical protein FBUS_06728 [Fasciolopsis buskii]|uniref:R3H domain-containing protein n=1 Tax=Fasciolopsis buskii TaxID=27845 RepID=A0A8E0S767_9TREM|nr:hypothetical protein FBUS_06728 [Fasciolopsis buski]